jgi:GrpB-like predicted nucleotidyltransferase (UPF0157 family)
MTKPVMRLLGEMKMGGDDWTLEEYHGLFDKLGSIAEVDIVTRLVRYFGESNGQPEVRFLGLQVGAAVKIPEGMGVLELTEDTVTISKPVGKGIGILWSDRLAWDWLDCSVPGFPVGEFTAHIPADWTSQTDSPLIEFQITANSYLEKGRNSDDNVHIVKYDAGWLAQYEEMADWLRENIPPAILLNIEHIGSTAIPGMPAKPVIDILLEVPSFTKARRALIPVFNRPDCEYWEYDGHPVFIKRKEFLGTRTHHIHVALAGSLRDRVAFRDYLRSYPGEAKRYADLKYELAERYRNDRETYTNEKARFVREITDKAMHNLNY